MTGRRLTRYQRVCLALLLAAVACLSAAAGAVAGGWAMRVPPHGPTPAYKIHAPVHIHTGTDHGTYKT